MQKLSDINIHSTFVLIKPEKDIEQLKSGFYVKASKQDNARKIANTEARHYNITGEVLAIPQKLIFRGEELTALRKKTGGSFCADELKQLQALVSGSMEYKTEIEIQKGDKVWFDYLCHINAVTENKTIEVEGFGECILVDYSRLFIREREGHRIPINGWIFIKKLKGIKELEHGFVLSDSVDLTLRNQAEVFQVGTPNQEYLSLKYTDFFFRDLKAGDKIIYKESLSTPLEYSLHETEGLETLYKIKRTDIRAIINDECFAFCSDTNTKFKVYN